jgi:hypothetical protein
MTSWSFCIHGNHVEFHSWTLSSSELGCGEVSDKSERKTEIVYDKNKKNMCEEKKELHNYMYNETHTQK